MLGAVGEEVAVVVAAGGGVGGEAVAGAASGAGTTAASVTAMDGAGIVSCGSPLGAEVGVADGTGTLGLWEEATARGALERLTFRVGPP